MLLWIIQHIFQTKSSASNGIAMDRLRILLANVSDLSTVDIEKLKQDLIERAIHYGICRDAVTFQILDNQLTMKTKLTHRDRSI